MVDGNRGLIEYNDLFKRPPEYNRYLLSTSEKGTVALNDSILYLDVMLMGSANETYLEAFKQSPDYPSYKARFELIRMPYLRDYLTEQKIYTEQISSTEIGKPLAPHSTYVAALWAVLTRLKRPRAERFSEDVREIIRGLSPLQKADLYATGQVPEGVAIEQAKELRALVPELLSEGAETNHYEGRHGISPRDMKAVILNAAQNSNYPHLSPLAIFDELRQLVRDTSVYRFLQIEKDEPYHCYEDFIATVQDRYLDILDRELRLSIGLVDEQQYNDFFIRYIEHVTHWVKGEKIYNRLSDRYDEPDESLMLDAESKLGTQGESKKFRNNIMSSIAAWSIDHPGETIEYTVIFPQYLDALKQSFFQERLEQLKRINQNLLAYLHEQESKLSAQEITQVETTLENLCTRFHHTPDSAREAIVFLLRNRYAS